MAHDNLHALFDQAGKILEGVANLKQQLGAALDENAKLKESQRWRKFSEEKPDDGQIVWAYEANTKRILKLEYSKNDESEGFICFPYTSDFYPHITKWMPFEKPKAPEEG